MTEKELLELSSYHTNLKNHHEKMAANYKKRLRLLREAVAKRTSAQVTHNILERLQK
jgi:hypothetical protein